MKSLGLPTRFALVGLACAVAHNVILLAADRAHIHYAVSCVLSYVLVVLLGFGLHVSFTFQQPPTIAAFWRYCVSMAANYPITLALLFLMCDVAGWRVAIAAPAATVLLFAYNFLASRWAFLRQPVGAPLSASPIESTMNTNISARSAPQTPTDVSLATVQALIGRHIPLYRTHKPTYHTILLQSFLRLWDPAYARVLDVGGGTGIIAQAMKDLFGIAHVTSVDVQDRFLKTLDIETRVYDGATLPFADGSFDCVTFSNVLHHVPIAVRPALMRECARVVGRGPILIKDHLAASRLDHARLFALDAMGNIPFGGMVKANYLTAEDWQQLAAACGRRIERQISGAYRAGAFETVFPNRLEVTMRLIPAE